MSATQYIIQTTDPDTGKIMFFGPYDNVETAVDHISIIRDSRPDDKIERKIHPLHPNAFTA